MQFAWKLGVVMLIALVLVVLPGGGNALDVVLAFLSIAFLAAIAFLGYRFYHQYRLDIDTLEPNVRLALYGSLAVAILTVVATDRLFEIGVGIIVWFLLLGALLVRALLGLDAVPQLRLRLGRRGVLHVPSLYGTFRDEPPYGGQGRRPSLCFPLALL